MLSSVMPRWLPQSPRSYFPFQGLPDDQGRMQFPQPGDYFPNFCQGERLLTDRQMPNAVKKIRDTDIANPKQASSSEIIRGKQPMIRHSSIDTLRCMKLCMMLSLLQRSSRYLYTPLFIDYFLFYIPFPRLYLNGCYCSCECEQWKLSAILLDYTSRIKNNCSSNHSSIKVPIWCFHCLTGVPCSFQ